MTISSAWRRQVGSIETAVHDPGIALANRDQLERDFSGLTPEQRALIVLHYYLGLPMAETAEILGLAVGDGELPALGPSSSCARRLKRTRGCRSPRGGRHDDAVRQSSTRSTGSGSRHHRAPGGLLESVIEKVEQRVDSPVGSLLKGGSRCRPVRGSGQSLRTAIILLAVLAVLLGADALAGAPPPSHSGPLQRPDHLLSQWRHHHCGS